MAGFMTELQFTITIVGLVLFGIWISVYADLIGMIKSPIYGGIIATLMIIGFVIVFWHIDW